ncbi:DUF7657 domain-containing protein [Vibrio vulnificus]|uniref:DUF7657 domain-containing protein n=1 Tax=Vibrio vulnificus TaxID=672 RepID=UPI003B512887
MRFIRQLELDAFDWFCLLLLIPITIFAITPSSYGIVLNMFGYNGEGLLWGTPRPIRSDEWSVWTPYMQMAVLNDFGRFNELSTYHQDLRGFNALPLWDWALVFKPLMWPFWLLEPARAFALHHGLVIVAFLIGWKRLIIRCLQDLLSDTKLQEIIAALFSILLFFTGFVQFWWTTLGPVLAFSPWLLLLILKWRHNVKHYIALGYVATVWLLSHTYPPIIVSIAYFGLLLLCVHKSDWWRSSPVQLISTALVCLAAVAVALVYYKDVIPVMMDTVYPGQRVSKGGESNWFMWLSTLLPYMTHSNFHNLIGMNICEVGAIASLLPMVAVSFIKPDLSNATTKRAVIGSVVLLVICAVWMLLPVPSFLAKVTLLYQIPGNRMLFLSGLVFNYLALIVIVTGELRVSWKRGMLFFLFLVVAIAIPSLLSLIDFGKKSLFELSSLVALAVLFYISRKSNSKRYIKAAVVLIAVIPNVLSYAWFNPAQSAFPIFDLHSRKEVSALQATALEEEPHWVVSRDYRGAILSGMGLNSFVSVLIQPQLKLFREMYPDMNETDFNHVFNRYGHVSLSIDSSTPSTPFLDVISIPLADLLPNKRFISSLYEVMEEEQRIQKVPSGGYVDSIVENADSIVIRGWVMAQPVEILGNVDLQDIAIVANQPRSDVAAALNDTRLQSSGFEMVVHRSSQLDQLIDQEGLCLLSHDAQYGVRELSLPPSLSKYKCKN